ncbi:PREDICTED: uncharacterized protein LOC104757663 [Camelina sativa]|uniref:Uncharacterized protein LOC104757663 n=1 Tax=Camelina sativa TaxID=90675 RepID=A0ABM0X093_CAMSA|nr:PREDICTED: uncharacterized protein LOC104757663 [Camelina sativa]
MKRRRAYDSDEAAAHTGDPTHHLLFSVFVQKNTPSLSVPQFGDWDQKRGGTLPDYSLDLTKIEEMRKQKKRDPSPASLGNEDDELIKPPDSATSTTAKFTKLFMSRYSPSLIYFLI